MVYQDLTEQVLLNKCSTNDTAAFQVIYDDFKTFVFGIVNARIDDRDDALDVTQDIFISLWENRKQLAGIRDFKTYLYVYSRNKVISAYRKKNIRLKGETYLLEKLDRVEHSSEQNLFARELTTSIDNAVGLLPETMRNCYTLSKSEGKTNNEIADILQISEKTVRNNVSEALKRLRFYLQRNNPEIFMLLLSLSLLFRY
ncbi:RNA polymerase sigma-70 factor, ECF subfamily [Mucilaginibacter mallensis]|uniref:RNA polymerase sigma-70 factor, ECF subfamily n=1 Tax=Mucilaginibacter mallensis TaxID=652787 RepID=A0A1H2BGM4_MUCMA|nr:sigma-70 family RNA polymerase sigma factor [Mucilaginibacter mallensis]SDT57460.1 RNA polymerase sigma-70 factor, ECF subfamily [Mucilaginibacter mallensis]